MSVYRLIKRECPPKCEDIARPASQYLRAYSSGHTSFENIHSYKHNPIDRSSFVLSMGSVSMCVVLLGAALAVGSSPPFEMSRRPPIRTGARATRSSSTTSRRPSSTSTAHPRSSRPGVEAVLRVFEASAAAEKAHYSVATSAVQLAGTAACSLVPTLEDAAGAERWLRCLIARGNMTRLLAELRAALCERMLSLFGAQQTHAQSACASFPSASARSGVERKPAADAGPPAGRRGRSRDGGGGGGKQKVESRPTARSSAVPEQKRSNVKKPDARMSRNEAPLVRRSLEAVPHVDFAQRPSASGGIRVSSNGVGFGHRASKQSTSQRISIASRNQSSKKASGTVARVRRSSNAIATNGDAAGRQTSTTSAMLFQLTTGKPTDTSSEKIPEVSSVCSEEEEIATLCQFGDCVRIPYISIAVCR